MSVCVTPPRRPTTETAGMPNTYCRLAESASESAATLPRQSSTASGTPAAMMHGGAQEADPVDTAHYLCSALEALEQASVAAHCCEATCKDMVATVCCRARHICSMLIQRRAVHGAPVDTLERLSIRRTLNTILGLATRVAHDAMMDIYRCSALHPGGILLSGIQKTVLTNLDHLDLRVPRCRALYRCVASL